MKAPVLLLAAVIFAAGCINQTGPSGGEQPLPRLPPVQYQGYPPHGKTLVPCADSVAEADVVEMDRLPGFAFSFPRAWDSEWSRYSLWNTSYYFREADGTNLPGDPILSVSSGSIIYSSPSSGEINENLTLDDALSARLYFLENVWGVDAAAVDACGTTLGGMKAYRLEYAKADNGKKYAEVSAASANQGVYDVFYSVDEENFGTYLTGFETIVRSFRVK